MKLPNVSRGPVMLLDIDYAENLSEETFAFTAMISVDGVGSARVSNDGRGGENRVRDRLVLSGVERFAATLPPERAHGMTLPITADFLISLMVGDAIEKHDQQAQRAIERMAQ